MMEKTCGTCAFFIKDKGACEALLEDDGSYCKVASDSEACEEWTHPSEILDDAELIEQLSAVAKDMCCSICESAVFSKPVTIMKSEQFCERLKELVVNLDD